MAEPAIEWQKEATKLRDAMMAKCGDFDVDAMLAETIEELFGPCEEVLDG